MTALSDMVAVQRLSDDGKATLGVLIVCGQTVCYTLEDTSRPVKVKHETRIPAGNYAVEFKRYGRFHEIYSKRYGEKHAGMIKLLDVPNFSEILLHAGNTHEDTSGCILLGESKYHHGDGSVAVGGSRAAYERVYPLLLALNRNKLFRSIRVMNES